MMNTVDNKVLERIKKMLALANDPGATEGERETALRMAYNLLAKHNLSMGDIPKDGVQEPREQDEVTISADKWARHVASAVGKLFFCKYFFYRTASAGRDRHCFVGRASNVATATYMAEYLIKAIKREASKRYTSPTSPNGRSFCVGTTGVIWKRVDEMMKSGTDETTAAESGALVVIRTQEQRANDAWLEAQGTSLVSAKERADNALRANAYHDGRAYGKTVSLNTQVGGANYKRLA